MKQHPAVLALAALALGLVGCDRPAPAPPGGPAATATNAPAPAAKPHPDLEKLKGKWERPDGGYVLEVRGIDAEGRVDAAYFNPAPIHVARGLAYREAGMTKLFIELRDVNYPGCTYALEFDAKNDQLFGQYFQATMNQTYDIVFVRMK
jgi:hypothetical protein